jgi:hypothetical protein
MSLCVGDRPVCRSGRNFPTCIPDLLEFVNRSIRICRQLSSRTWSCSKAVYQPVWHIPLLSVQWINSWWWTDELSETCRVSWQNEFVKLVQLVGFIIKKSRNSCVPNQACVLQHKMIYFCRPQIWSVVTASYTNMWIHVSRIIVEILHEDFVRKHSATWCNYKIQ